MFVVMVAMIVVVVLVNGIGADTANVMVMALLHGSDFGLIADDLRAVFAELAIHRRRAVADPAV